jgi:hypothetical protein
LGMKTLAQLLRTPDESRIVVAPFDIERLLFRFQPDQVPPLLRALAVDMGNSDKARSRPLGSEFAATWRAALPDRRHGLMVTFLREQVAAVMGFNSLRQLNSRQGFTSLGIDSLMAVELKARLQMALGLTLPNTLAFEYPNIEALAVFLSCELSPDRHLNGNGKSPKDVIRAEETDSMESLSEDEIASLLADKLEVLSGTTDY